MSCHYTCPSMTKWGSLQYSWFWVIGKNMTGGQNLSFFFRKNIFKNIFFLNIHHNNIFFLIGPYKHKVQFLTAHISESCFEWYHTWRCSTFPIFWLEYCRVLVFASKCMESSILLQWSTFFNFNTPLKDPHLVVLGHILNINTYLEIVW